MDTINESYENIPSDINIPNFNQKIKEDEGILIIEKKNNNFGPGSARSKKKWTNIEDKLLLEIVSTKKGKKKWKEISSFFKNKSAIQCRSRWERIKPGIKSGRWTKEEDELLKQLYSQYGIKWCQIAQKMNNRTGKQIRERCKIILDRKDKREKLRKEDKLKLIKLYNEIGPNWILIRSYFNKKYNAETLKNAFYAYYRRKQKYGQVIIKYAGEVEKKEYDSLSPCKFHEIKQNIPANNDDNLSINNIKVKSPGSINNIIGHNLEKKDTMQSSECISETFSKQDCRSESYQQFPLNHSITLDSLAVIPGNQCNIYYNPRFNEQFNYLQVYKALEMQRLNIHNSYLNYIHSASKIHNLNNLNALIQKCLNMSMNSMNMKSFCKK